LDEIQWYTELTSVPGNTRRLGYWPGSLRDLSSISIVRTGLDELFALSSQCSPKSDLNEWPADPTAKWKMPIDGAARGGGGGCAKRERRSPISAKAIATAKAKSQRRQQQQQQQLKSE